MTAIRAISSDAARQWLARNRLIDLRGKLSAEHLGAPMSIQIPSDAGWKTALARLLARFVCTAGEGLLWIDEFGIWPSAENELLLTALRSWFGESRPLFEAPAHLFRESDAEVVSALLALVLYFSYGSILVAPAARLVVRISHDEFIEFRSADDSTRRAVQSELKRLSLQVS